MMNSVGQNKKINIIGLAVILIMAVGLGALASLNKVTYEYSWAETAETELSDEIYAYTYEGVEYDAASGAYMPLGDDPWILYGGINDQYSGILLSLKEPAKTDINIKLYWTRINDEAFSERNTVETVIRKGMRTGYIKLPAFDMNILRLDIDDECMIDNISLSKGNVIRSVILDNAFYLALCLKTIIIFIVLLAAYLAHLERINAGGKPVKGIFVDEVRTGHVHKYELDYIRTLAAVLVIMMHSVIETYVPQVSIGEPGYGTLKMILAISLVCNALYIMLSGALLLQPKEESIGEFYRRRLPKVIIPTLSYYLLYMLQGYPNDVFKDGILEGLKIIGKGLLTSRPEYMLHMWFIYAILGLYIFAPFLRIMVKNISDGQLFGLILAGFIMNCLASYLPMTGITFGIDTPVASWIGVFLLGYYMTTDHAKNKYNLFMALGIVGMTATALMVYYHPEFLYYESNWTPMMWLEGAGIFALFSKFKGVFGKRNVVIASIAKYNFSIMLIHVLLLMKVILPNGWRLEAQYGHLKIFIFGMIVVCFAASYCASVLYDNTAVIAANYVYNRIAKGKRR